MKITREFIVERLSKLEVQRLHAVSQLGSVDGAIQICREILTEMDKLKPEKRATKS